jgi:hypothetical protein
MGITARSALDTGAENEIILEILSYSKGINAISEDHVMQANEARTVENWDAISVGGMIRAKGIDLIASASGSTASDLGHFHFEDSTGTGEILGIIGGALVKSSSPSIATITGGVFTSGTLSHAAGGEDESWITNSTDNLRRYTVAGGLTTPSDQPANARDRIYRHKNRLIAEGGGVRVYGSRVLSANWTAADAWSLANDAWNIDLPNKTQGCAVGFPSGDTVTVFDKFKAYILSNFPAVRFDPVPNSRGCVAPLSIALGEEGVYFLSDFPTLGVFLWDGTRFVDLTVEQDFIDEIDLDKRVYAVYRERRYNLFYNEENSGVTYPNRWKVFDARFARWMDRPLNSGLSDTLGYPVLLNKQNNEFYNWSSQKRIIYELEATNDSDNGNDTESVYKTKDFTSRDFLAPGSGRSVPLDESLIKITKVTMTYFGTVGTVRLQWNADRGRASGTVVFDLTAAGAKINDDFTVNTSQIVSAGSLQDKKITKSVSNAAVGRTFSFQILNDGSSTRPRIKKLKIHGILLSDD